jgi:hypothetical protein
MAVVAVVSMLALLGAGCAQEGRSGAEKTDAAADAPCPDDGERLPVTGICRGRANAYLNEDREARTPELPDCTWTVNELALPGDEALLYRAAMCGGVTTTLAFAGGAQSAELVYERSALFGDAVIGRAAVWLFGAPPDNPQGALRGAIAEAPDGAAMQCEIRPAGLEGWPRDALLIAPSAAARARLPQDEPIAACGPYGVDEDSVRYWRVAQGFAWFFDLGQEQPDFDPTSLTVLVRSADGGWQIKD